MFSTFYISPIGDLQLLADTDRITAILFEEQFITAESKSNLVIDQCQTQLDEYFSGYRRSFDFRMQQTGTDFQQRVWQQLLQINYGRTISYLQLSKNLGDVKAIRAVGTANGRNKLSIVVPCHRVIATNGNLTGYAGGLWRKKWLLEHEAKYANGQNKLF